MVRKFGAFWHEKLFLTSSFGRNGNFQTVRWRLERTTPNSTVQTLFGKWVCTKRSAWIDQAVTRGFHHEHWLCHNDFTDHLFAFISWVSLFLEDLEWLLVLLAFLLLPLSFLWVKGTCLVGRVCFFFPSALIEAHNMQCFICRQCANLFTHQVDFFLALIPATQEDDCRSEKSGQGGQDWHENNVILLQSQGQSRKEVIVV